MAETQAKHVFKVQSMLFLLRLQDVPADQALAKACRDRDLPVSRGEIMVIK